MGLVTSYKNMGRPTLEAVLEDDEQLVTYVHGKIHRNLGTEVIANWFPFSKTAARAQCLIGATNKRVIIYRPAGDREEVYAIPPQPGFVKKRPGAMSVLTLKLAEGTYRVYGGRTSRRELNDIADAIKQLRTATP